MTSTPASVRSSANSWELQFAGLELQLQSYEGRLHLRHAEDRSSGSASAPWDPFEDSLWRSESLLGVELGEAGRQVLWEVVDVSSHDRSLVVQLVSDNAPMSATMVMTSHHSGSVSISSQLKNTATDGQALSLTALPIVALVVPHVKQTVHLAGSWAAESQVRRADPSASLFLESRTGKTGFEYQPYTALLRSHSTIVVQLEWSGNWFLRTRPLLGGSTGLTAGLNRWGLRHRLAPGHPLDLPEVTIVSVEGDLNKATQVLHGARRARVSHFRRPVPVQFNSWYPRQGEPDLATLRELAAPAARVGCEVFVLDAGWYANARSTTEDWWTRTGDWLVAEHLFPDGLEPLVRSIHDLGLDFGIWFEPEAVGPTSRVFDHGNAWIHELPNNPHWFGGREIRHLGVEQAREAVRDRMIEVVKQTNATWLKWDFNTDLLQGGWPSPAISELDPLIAHYQGLYLLQQELKQAHPDLFLEMCAGGGGRFDAAIMRNADVTWMSDQTQAITNLAIHLGSQLSHPPEECNDWLVEWPPHDTRHGRGAVDERGDLAFRTRVAMLGSFGVSAPLQRWSENELDFLADKIDWYKTRHRPLLPRSDQYLLGDDSNVDGLSSWSAIWYADQNQRGGHALVFQLDSDERSTALCLSGMDDNRVYDIRIGESRTFTATGSELASGLTVPLSGRYSSETIEVVEHGSD